MKKIGLDIHGVLDAQPKLLIAMAMQYDEVHVITGGSFTDTNYDLEGDLYKLGEQYFGYKVKWWTHEFSVYDHLLDIGAKTNEELGIASHHPFPDETWNKVKAEYCTEHNIDLHVDDMMQYLEYFTTPFMFFKDPTRKHRGQE